MARLGLVIGVSGRYTTFSTFAQETLDLVEEGSLDVAALYAFGSLTLGVFAVYVGMLIGRAPRRPPAAAGARQLRGSEPPGQALAGGSKRNSTLHRNSFSETPKPA